MDSKAYDLRREDIKLFLRSAFSLFYVTALVLLVFYTFFLNLLMLGVTI